MSLSRRRSRLYAAIALGAGAMALSTGWLRSAHVPAQAMEVAQAFVDRLEQGRFAQAFELTIQQGHVGSSPADLRAVASREFCTVDRLVSTFPFQSNGNRLRRLVSGREVDMPQVQVEFAGDCLLGVTVRRTEGGAWRVSRFARHAG